MEIINDVIKNVALFVQENEQIKPDFEEYIKTVSGSMNTQAAYFNYIFERYLNNKSILDLYMENSKNISKEEKDIVKTLKKRII